MLDRIAEEPKTDLEGRITLKNAPDSVRAVEARWHPTLTDNEAALGALLENDTDNTHIIAGQIVVGGNVVDEDPFITVDVGVPPEGIILVVELDVDFGKWDEPPHREVRAIRLITEDEASKLDDRSKELGLEGTFLARVLQARSE